MHIRSIFIALLLLLPSPALSQGDFAVPPAPHMEDYFKPGLAPVRADPASNLTIVYFMDYQCPACRRYTPDVNAVFRADRKLRIIYRDTPIFGPRSVEAAKFAIASQFQGKHEAFHRALMAQPLPLDDQAIRAAAAKAGVDWARLQRDRASHAKAIDAQIAQNQNLSEAAGISGTPAFIIGDTLANGALDAAGLRAEISDARSKSGGAAPPAAEKVDVEAEKKPEPVVLGPQTAETNAVEPAPANPAATERNERPTFKPAEAASPSEPAAPPARTGPLLIAIVLLAGAAAAGLLAIRRRQRRGG